MYQLRDGSLPSHDIGSEPKGRCLSTTMILGSEKLREKNDES